MTLDLVREIRRQLHFTETGGERPDNAVLAELAAEIVAEAEAREGPMPFEVAAFVQEFGGRAGS